MVRDHFCFNVADRIKVESVYPRKKDIPRSFLDAIVGDTRRQVENKRVEQVVASGSVELDLRRALEVRTPLLDAHRTF